MDYRFFTLEDAKQVVLKFINPELCKFTEDVIFVDPYLNHMRNRINPLISEQVEKSGITRIIKDFI